MRPSHMDPDKRQLRKLKRVIKRVGGKRRRQQFRRELAENPEDAPFSTFDFGDTSSASLNGMDRDSTRRRESD